MSPHLSIQSPLAAQRSTDDLILEAEDALAALEDVDAEYERERDAIQQWPVSERAKARMLGRLQADRQAKREPLVEKMVALRELLKNRV